MRLWHAATVENLKGKRDRALLAVLLACGLTRHEAVNLDFRHIQQRDRNGKTWSEGLTEKAVWHVVREYARKTGIEELAPHDLRRACARLCHAAGGELEQIQFLLGHVSIQTTERYLGCKQRIRSAVNDRIGIEPEG